jgi:hypothetical protein
MKVLKSLFTKCLWTILMIVFGWVLGMTTLYLSTDSEVYKHMRNKYGLD